MSHVWLYAGTAYCAFACSRKSLCGFLASCALIELDFFFVIFIPINLDVFSEISFESEKSRRLLYSLRH